MTNFVDGEIKDGRTVVILSALRITADGQIADRLAPKVVPAEKGLSPAGKKAAAKKQAAALVTAAASGVPFCEECDRARRKLEALRRAA